MKRTKMPGTITATEESIHKGVAHVSDFGMSKSLQMAGLSGMSMTGNTAGTPVFMPPEQIINFKSSLNASLGVFASYLGVSKAAVVAWEYGIRQPSGAARKLLSIARKNPEILVAA